MSEEVIDAISEAIEGTTAVMRTMTIEDGTAEVVSELVQESVEMTTGVADVVIEVVRESAEMMIAVVAVVIEAGRESVEMTIVGASEEETEDAIAKMTRVVGVVVVVTILTTVVVMAVEDAVKSATIEVEADAKMIVVLNAAKTVQMTVVPSSAQTVLQNAARIVQIAPSSAQIAQSVAMIAPNVAMIAPNVVTPFDAMIGVETTARGRMRTLSDASEKTRLT
mmetsp:Transcript_94640/g.149688  ORF Transcript_94640/g.149688 Transcript_94640/m.149688 type:complete len:223 (-) Transcript_94640:3422-4090(-)